MAGVLIAHGQRHSRLAMDMVRGNIWSPQMLFLGLQLSRLQRFHGAGLKMFEAPNRFLPPKTHISLEL